MADGIESLVEREAELRSASMALGEIAAGTGGVIAVEGPAGIGKSALLGEITGRAAGDGFATHSARGSELEVDFAFGVVRQLFESVIGELGPDVALAGAAAPRRASSRRRRLPTTRSRAATCPSRSFTGSSG